MTLTIHTDGGSRGNPGEAAIGIAAFEDEKLVFEQAAYIGIATNNEAEYQALHAALQWLKTYRPDGESPQRIIFKLDSKLVVEQINRNWKIKEDRLRLLAQQCWQIIDTLPQQPVFTHVRRELNTSADALVNQALDSRLS